MSVWTAWSSSLFDEAKRRGKPILLVCGPNPPTGLGASAEAINNEYIGAFVDPAARPDVALRVAQGRALLLDVDGATLAESEITFEAVKTMLSRQRQSLSRGSIRDAKVWTGAVGEKPAKAPPTVKEVSAVFRKLYDASKPGGPEIVEALLHAAGEREDDRALAEALLHLDHRKNEEADARWAALFWDVYALTGEQSWRNVAVRASKSLMADFFDVRRGAFRRRPGLSVYPAEGNALAAIALLRAAAFDVPGAASAANHALDYLRNDLYDPLLGLLHARGGGEDATSGLLGDAAWTALAFTEAFTATGRKVNREFADTMMRFMFQELWEREAGGFADRVPRARDPEFLRKPVVDPSLNSIAFEACRRLHHLKGNHNYRKWLEWGLSGVWPLVNGRIEHAAPLARVADLHARGRMDFELIGRLGEAKADALLAAMNRLYSPRKVISFVDPDDQDYILAHKLEADAYPRVFACGKDLKRLADAATPDAVAGLIDVLKKA